MATPAWQPRAGLPASASMAGPQGLWGPPGVPINQGHAPPQLPLPGAPPLNFPPQMSGSLAPFGNPNQLSPASGSGLQPSRPALVPAPPMGAPYTVPQPGQSGPGYGIAQNPMPTKGWPSQAAGSAPVPASADMPTHGKDSLLLGSRPGMAPATPSPSGAGSVLHEQRPPFQAFPPQHLLPPWMQLRPRPLFMSYQGEYEGVFPGQQQRHLVGSPSDSMLASGPHPSGSGESQPFQATREPSISQGGPPLPAWAPYGAPPSVTLTTASEGGMTTSKSKPADSAVIVQVKTDIAPPGEQAVTGSGDKLKKGAGETIPDLDAWTAHKTEDGAIYYYNSLSCQSTYTRPVEFKGEADKVTAQPTPVSWEHLSGTDWALVMTNDSKKYYYNTRTQVTSWQIPAEVAELRKKQEELAGNAGDVGPPAEKSPISFTINVPAALTGGREAIGHKALAANSALDLIKKKLQDPGAPVTSSLLSASVAGPTGVLNVGTAVDDNIGKGTGAEGGNGKPLKGDQVSTDDDSDSDDEDLGPTKEQKVLRFKEMLKEKAVAPFSKWEKELPKIIFDPRFKAIPSHTERRSIFEHYVRTRAEEERKEKRAAQKAAVEAFRSLLEEVAKDISHSTDYDSFAKLWGHEPRFESLERKDRESLLNERVGPLRKAEEERLRAEHAAALAGFRALLSERHDITTATRWAKVKDDLRSDLRYRAVKRDDREKAFDAYIAELRAAEQEVEHAGKSKKDEEEKLRGKEREQRKRKDREEEELERVRLKARHKDAVTAYQALLKEKIKDPEASWTDARPKLERDGLGRASNPDLDLPEREKLFREHVNDLYERCLGEYQALLADTITAEVATKQGDEGKTILTSWSEAKKVLKLDPRYGKVPHHERESLWRRYVEDMQRWLKGARSSVLKHERSSVANTEGGKQSSGLRYTPSNRR